MRMRNKVLAAAHSRHTMQTMPSQHQNALRQLQQRSCCSDRTSAAVVTERALVHTVCSALQHLPKAPHQLTQ